MRIRGGTRLQTTLLLILSPNHLLITVRHPPPLSFSSSSFFSSFHLLLIIFFCFHLTVSIAKQWVTQASLKKQYDVIAVYTLSPFLFSGTSEMVEQIPHYKKVSYQSTFHLLQNWYVCVWCAHVRRKLIIYIIVYNFKKNNMHMYDYTNTCTHTVMINDSICAVCVVVCCVSSLEIMAGKSV